MESDQYMSELEYPISGPMVDQLVVIHTELLVDVPPESLDLVKNKIAQAIHKTCFVSKAARS